MSEAELDLGSASNGDAVVSTSAGSSEPRVGTDYVVLEQEGADTWRVVLKAVTASSADAAIRIYTDPPGESSVKKAGWFVAVPVRSFQPRESKVETVTTARLV